MYIYFPSKQEAKVRTKHFFVCSHLLLFIVIEYLGLLHHFHDVQIALPPAWCMSSRRKNKFLLSQALESDRYVHSSTTIFWMTETNSIKVLLEGHYSLLSAILLILLSSRSSGGFFSLSSRVFLLPPPLFRSNFSNIQALAWKYLR